MPRGLGAQTALMCAVLRRLSRCARGATASLSMCARCYGVSLDVRAVLRRLPRRPGAEERRACGDEEAAGEEEQEQQPS